MEKIVIYALLALAYGAFSLYQKKKEADAKRARQQASSQASAAQPQYAEHIEQSAPKPKKKKKKKSLAAEAYGSNLFQEGSSRYQHSSQFENSPAKDYSDHTEHPDYDEPTVDEKGFEMDADKMRQALIYQTILERPQY